MRGLMRRLGCLEDFQNKMKIQLSTGYWVRKIIGDVQWSPAKNSFTSDWGVDTNAYRCVGWIDSIGQGGTASRALEV